jgi:AAA domain-containing protein
MSDAFATFNDGMAEHAVADTPLKLYTPAELVQLPEPEWLAEPFIPAHGLVVLFGPSGTYKSFVAVDLAAHVDGLAVYISAEGSPRRFGERITAWEHAAGRSAGILCHPYAVNLLDHGADDLLKTIRALAEAPSWSPSTPPPGTRPERTRTAPWTWAA